MNDNIVAISTAFGHAGIGIVRVSGNNLLPIIQTITHKTKILARVAVYSNFYNLDGTLLDQGLVIYYPQNQSFTQEEIIEFHGHGNPVILNMLVNICIKLGCRMALNGEFTKRAYLNGKIDLLQAESVIDVINAESEAAAKSAIMSLSGTFSNYIDNINHKLIDLRMFVEATLDFPEEDIEFILEHKVQEKLMSLNHELATLLEKTRHGVLLNNGVNVVIIGKPNVGKSSLLNALSDEEIAIVTEVAGTTRDLIQQKIIISGIAFNFIDTAGIRYTEDPVEKIGINKALEIIKRANLCLIVIDDEKESCIDDVTKYVPQSISKIFIYNKIDLKNQHPKIELLQDTINIYISAKYNLGIDILKDKLLEMIGFKHSANMFTARIRHLNAIKDASIHIEYALTNWQYLELVAEELRLAHYSLSTITGEFTTEDLLGEIFSRFCIGK